jgi:sugar lactone lactonase YvrE
VCDYDVETGTPHNRRVFAKTQDWQGRPDGAAIDAMGNYWIAAVDGGALWCFSPGGERLRVVEASVRSPTKLAFGGESDGRVFLTSKAPNQEGHDGADSEGGYLLTATADVAGSPSVPVSLRNMSDISR